MGVVVWTRESTEPDDEGRVFIDVARDPVAVEEDAVLPGVRAWMGRLLTGNNF